MIIDRAPRVAPADELSCDVCIVGGGAAGITIALALEGRGLSVILLEGGDWNAHAPTQDLYRGQVANPALHSPPEFYRARRFGGSTTIWSGRCVPYDPLDFEQRDFIPYSGWPIGYEDVAPFYPAAMKLCEAGECAFRVAEALPSARAEMIPGFVSERVWTDRLERFSRPTNFAERYRSRLQAARDLRVLLNCNCIHIAASRDSQTIERLTIGTLVGRQFTVKAKQYVLATGGLEVTRLLLASRDVYRAGIGNEHDMLGRFYMAHIAGTLGRLKLTARRPRDFHGYELSPDGIYCRRRFQLTPEVQKELQIGNMIARMHHPSLADPAHRTGPLSALYLARNLMAYEFSGRAGAGTGSRRLWLSHVRNLLTDPIHTFRFATHWLTARTLAGRKFPSVIVNPRSECYTLDFHSEQMPEPSSRVRLGAECDVFGMPRLAIDWRYTPLDVRTVRDSFRVLAEEFHRTGTGTLEFDEAEVEAAIVREGAYGGHHLGTTRMSDSPRDGVVDGNCRVHGLNNLYIASSSVFPTSSQANPTLTIVALALRLARHLETKGMPAEMLELETAV